MGMYTVHCTLYTVHCTLYTVHCTLYTVHCTLYTVHCTCMIVLNCYFTDDSEPILGQWFEQTLSPNEDTLARPLTPPTLGTEEGGTESGKHSKKHLTVKNASIVPDKKEPHAVSITCCNSGVFSR